MKDGSFFMLHPNHKDLERANFQFMVCSSSLKIVDLDQTKSLETLYYVFHVELNFL